MFFFNCSETKRQKYRQLSSSSSSSSSSSKWTRISNMVFYEVALHSFDIVVYGAHNTRQKSYIIQFCLYFYTFDTGHVSIIYPMRALRQACDGYLSLN